VRVIARGTLLALIFLALTLLQSTGQAQALQKTVRVKLTTLNFPLQISGGGISIRGIKKTDIKNISIPRVDESFRVDNHKVGGKNIWFINKGDSFPLKRLSEKYIEIDSSSSQVEISGYKVSTPVLITQAGEIIAAMPLNNYLEGVLAGEMPASWPIEALKAQAVAARSYTLFQINQRKNNIFQLEGSVLDQVYSSSISPDQLSVIKQALAETEGMVLTHQNKIIKAYYHSDCGGRTEDPERIWGGARSNINSVEDRYCAFNPHSQWIFEISLEEMRKKIESPIKSIRIVNTTPSGRAALIAFNVSDDKNILISGNELRKILGFQKLRSTLFSVRLDRDRITFAGRGFGHGSGLCQYGARYMAQKGAKVQEILKHYYPTARLLEVSHVANL